MDINSDIRRLLADPSAPITREWLQQVREAYPAFTLPTLLYLKRNGLKGNEQLLSQLAIATSDRRALAQVLGPGAKRWAGFYPPDAQPVTPDTDAAIDQFLDNYGHSNPKEIEAITNAIFNPTPDYADILAREEQEESKKRRGRTPSASDRDADDELISKFIEQSRRKEQQAAPATVMQPHIDAADKAEIAATPIDEPKATDESMLSESLAKTYIARGNYAKALEIIETINLKFPEKSIYFADQIRFLRKLVLNQKANGQ